jgi:hypothetical protein
MAPTPPLIDDGNYMALLGELLGRIPVHDPEWTDFEDSDPGVTLVELFAFLAETLLWQIDRQRQRRRRRRVAFLVVGTAGVGLVLWMTCERSLRPQS